MSVLILGSGVVGEATGLGLRHLGHEVGFVDIDGDRLTELSDRGLATVHADQLTLDGVEAVFVAVPTPSTVRGIDLSAVDAACKALGSALQTADTDPLIVFRSTMVPGTTRHGIVPQLQDMSGRSEGDAFHVCYNPEYLRARTAVEDFLGRRFVTIGTACPGGVASQRLRQLFAGFDARFSEFTFEQAEFQKYVHNLVNAVKISFFNEMRRAAAALDIDGVDEVFDLTAATAEAIWNPAYGLADRGPFAGACLPKDTMAWLIHTREHGAPAHVVQAARLVNLITGGPRA